MYGSIDKVNQSNNNIFTLYYNTFNNKNYKIVKIIYYIIFIKRYNFFSITENKYKMLYHFCITIQYFSNIAENIFFYKNDNNQFYESKDI